MKIVSMMIVLSLIAGCKRSLNENLVQSESSSADGAGLVCAAIRGNGELIWGHFGSLASLLEKQGMIDGVAGGSSGSISSFLFESIMINPALKEGCASTPCAPQEAAKRAALLLKTIYYWLDVARDSKEGRALNHLYVIATALKDFNASDLTSLSVDTIRQSITSLVEVLGSETLRDLINDDFIQFVKDPAIFSQTDTSSIQMLKFRASEAQKAVQQFGKFDASTADIFFRPGLVNFRAVGTLIGHIADFYAGYSPHVAPLWAGLFKECVDTSVGKLPWEVLQGSCSQRFKEMVDLYMAHVSELSVHRVDEAVGSHLHVLAATAVLVNGQDRLNAAWERYREGKSLDLQLSADDFKIGYASTAAVLAKAASVASTQQDLKSAMFTSLGAMKWADVLAVSPAEPGLTNVQKFTDGSSRTLYSFGGWGDLSPVQILKASGCGKVIYVTRQGEESPFAQQVATQAGFGAMLEKLFSATNSASSYYQAMHQADAIYCTNWNAYSGFSTDGIQGLWRNSYGESILYTSSDPSAPVGCRK